MGLGLDNFDKSESQYVSVSTTLENQSLGLNNLKNVITLSLCLDS